MVIGLDSGAVVSTSVDCVNGFGVAVAGELPKVIAFDSGDSCSVGLTQRMMAQNSSFPHLTSPVRWQF